MTIKEEFDQADNGRSAVLDRIRQQAQLSIYEVLPAADQSEDTKIERAYTNVGTKGIENMVGRLLVALFPPGIPWFRLVPSAIVKTNPLLDDAEKKEIEAILYGRELLIHSQLESMDYRLAQRTALESLMVAGNSLTKLTDDFRLDFFRLDCWVPKRDGSGQLLWLITKEKKDISQFTDEELRRAQLSRDETERSQVVYTKVELKREGGWLIRQELNDRPYGEPSEPKVSPYFPVTYRLSTGESHARSFISSRMGELRSTNGLWMSVVEAAAVLSKMTPVVDPTDPNMTLDSLCQENLVPVYGQVTGGVVQKAAFLQSNKAQDFSGALAAAQDLRTSLGKEMLMESEAMPQGERVTATAVLRIARELEGALGGPYAQIATEMQRPLLDAVIYQMEAKLKLPFFTDEMARLQEMEILTGISALSRQMDLDRLMQSIQILSTFPGGLERLDLNVVADRVLRYMLVDTQGLVKTPEQVAAEMAAHQRSELESEAGSQAIATIGKLVEQKAAQAA